MPSYPPHLTLAAMKARAEATFRARHEQKAQAPIATREYREAEQELRDKTEKLRAARLARQAAAKT